MHDILEQLEQKRAAARLGGGLAIEPAPGSWTPDRRWIIVQADGGLEYGADGGGDPVPGDGRFDRVASALRYLDPVLEYGANTVTLGLRYNAQGLSTADAAWRGARIARTRPPPPACPSTVKISVVPL